MQIPQLSTISNALLSVGKSLLSTAGRKSCRFIKETHILSVDHIVSDICDILPEFKMSFPFTCRFKAVKKCSAASLQNIIKEKSEIIAPIPYL